jgi:hypothetical protein
MKKIDNKFLDWKGLKIFEALNNFKGDEIMGLSYKLKNQNYAKEFKEIFIENNGSVNIDSLITCLNEWENNIPNHEQDANYQLAKSMVCGIFCMFMIGAGMKIDNLVKPLQSTLDALKTADNCSPQDSSLYEWYSMQSNIIESQLLKECK